jgi:hypothetical protein
VIFTIFFDIAGLEQKRFLSHFRKRFALGTFNRWPPKISTTPRPRNMRITHTATGALGSINTPRAIAEDYFSSPNRAAIITASPRDRA